MPIGPQNGHETLLMLARDTDWQVRQSVAMRPNMSDTDACEIFEILAHDTDWHVRYMLAKNKYIPLACAKIVFEILLNDTDNVIQEAVKENPVYKKYQEAV